MELAEHAAHMGEMKNVRKLERITQHGRPERRSEDNIKQILKKWNVSCELDQSVLGQELVMDPCVQDNYIFCPVKDGRLLTS
jgi:hypothetical protein